MNFTVQGLSYTELMANATLLSNFETSMRQTILAAARRAGRDPQDVEIVLSSGSVIVEAIMIAQVNAGESVTMATEALVDAINQEGETLQQELLSEIANIEGISSVSTIPVSELSVSPVFVVVTVVETTTITTTTHTATITTSTASTFTGTVTTFQGQIDPAFGTTELIIILVSAGCLLLLGIVCCHYGQRSRAAAEVAPSLSVKTADATTDAREEFDLEVVASEQDGEEDTFSPDLADEEIQSSWSI